MELLKKILSIPKAFIAGLLLLFFTFIGCCLVVVGVIFLPKARAIGDLILYVWAKCCLAVIPVDLEVEGLENIPEEGCLFLFNHTSLLDIPIFYAAIRKTARFGAKAELFKIPLFSQTATRLGALKIHRGDRERVLKLYEDSIKDVNERGRSFALAAEGTRIDRAGVGDEFKTGPLSFALSGQFQIVPIVMIGAFEILPKSRLFPRARWHNPVKIKVLPPVPTNGLSFDDRHELKADLHAKMTKAFSEG